MQSTEIKYYSFIWTMQGTLLLLKYLDLSVYLLEWGHWCGNVHVQWSVDTLWACFPFLPQGGGKEWQLAPFSTERSCWSHCQLLEDHFGSTEKHVWFQHGVGMEVIHCGCGLLWVSGTRFSASCGGEKFLPTPHRLRTSELYLLYKMYCVGGHVLV